MKGLLLLVTAAVVQAQVDCNTFTDCNTCVSAASQGECGWCRSSSRCFPGTSAGANPIGNCPNPNTNWIYGGASKILSQTSGFPVNPVFFNVYLYPNSPLTLPVTVTNPLTDTVPLDLYIIEDVSGSMGDDVATFFTLARALTVDVLRYQTNPRFGLGSFGDKPRIPNGLDPYCNNNQAHEWPDTWTIGGTQYSYTDMESACVAGQVGSAARCALTPCPTRTPSSGPFNWAFCHELDLTDNYPALQVTVGTLVTHVNGDWPENQLEALMFTATCPMGWRPGARRVVLVASDASPQEAVAGNCSAPLCFQQPAQYNCQQAAGSNQAIAANCDTCNTLSCTPKTTVPGTRSDYPESDRVAALLSLANIVPIIASAKALPDHNDLPGWQNRVNGWGFGKVLELAGDSSNLIQLIRQALAELATVMVMTLCTNGCDPFNQVQSYQPVLGYQNVPAGDKRFFTIDLLDTDTVELSTIQFSVVGFGDVTINVTNQIPCLGCDGSNNPNIVVDLCGECNGANTCLGCDGLPYSGSAYDNCGICGGNSRGCYDCTNVQWGTATYDACFICDGDNSTCTDCAGTVWPPGSGGAVGASNRAGGFLTIDECGICGGDGRSCRGCDGIVNSTKTRDNCSVCGGDNSSCVVVVPPPPSAVPAIAGGAVAGAVFATIAIIAVILIVGALAKKKWDKMQYMNNQGHTALGSSPLYKETGGWQSNPNAN